MTCVPAHMLLVHLFVEATYTFAVSPHTHCNVRVVFRMLVSNKLGIDRHARTHARTHAHTHTHTHTQKQHGQTKSQTDNEQLAL